MLESPSGQRLLTERVARPLAVRTQAARQRLSDPRSNFATTPRGQRCLGVSVSSIKTMSPSLILFVDD